MNSKILDQINKLKKYTNLSFESNELFLSVNGIKLFLSEEHQIILLDEFINCEDNSAIYQIFNASKNPSIKGIVGLPDMHAGYFFPVGSVIAVDLYKKDAWISPEGVGFDINCGVRALKTNLIYENNSIKYINKNNFLFSDLENIANKFNLKISSGTVKSVINISIKELNDILNNGLKAEIFKNENIDFTKIESEGSLKGDFKLISQKAKGKGLKLLGSLGSGNHYLELQYVDKIFNKELANEYNLIENQIVIFIHTGSRGLGHEVCQSYLDRINTIKGFAEQILDSKYMYDQTINNRIYFENVITNNNIDFENRKRNTYENKNKIINFYSKLGQEYFTAMNSAANYAFANRQIISQLVNEVLKEIFTEVNIELIYDCCHNIAKIEEINGEKILVHRKGASRAAPGNNNYSQPIPVGGSMATASYIIASNGPEETFYSTCHGSGRVIPRSKAKEHFNFAEIEKDMKNKSIIFKSQTEKGIIEEAGGCYKDIDLVVEHSEKVGLTKTVLRLKPLIVIKG